MGNPDDHSLFLADGFGFFLFSWSSLCEMIVGYTTTYMKGSFHMPMIQHEIYIEAPVNVCFDLARNVDVHTETTSKTKGTGG
ncbi:hypothetical protein KH172YL63_33910 [Bacillus sp. KH172YL63]|nr:hypothetical protein KH172YL63_33910 [Bacillus sp. KH172YL63]